MQPPRVLICVFVRCLVVADAEPRTYHGTIPSVGVGILIIWLDDTSIRWLEILASRRLDLYERFIVARR